jgi:hypothetical protein
MLCGMTSAEAWIKYGYSDIRKTMQHLITAEEYQKSIQQDPNKERFLKKNPHDT